MGTFLDKLAELALPKLFAGRLRLLDEAYLKMMLKYGILNGSIFMLVKEAAKQVIDSLPNNVTMDDIIHALYVNVKFSHGEKEIREGKGVSQEEAKKKLEKWLK